MHNTLLEAARQLTQPSPNSAAEFDQKRSIIAATASIRLTERPDIEHLVGKPNLPLMDDNCHNFTTFMHSQLHAFSPETLVETCVWAIGVYRARGFDRAFWPANLRTFIHVIEEILSETASREVRPFYEWIQTNLPQLFEAAEAPQEEK